LALFFSGEMPESRYFSRNLFIKLARKPRAFKLGDEWLPGTKPAFAGGVEVILA
jgi:hypothetical protein